MDIEAIVGVMGDYLTCEDLFKFSRVNTIWYNGFVLNKKERIQKLEEKIMKAHYCGNFCPCAITRVKLEKYYINPQFNLEGMICKKLNGEKIPDWLQKNLIF